MSSVPADFYRRFYPARLVLVTSVDEKGKPNIITLAWAMPASFEPPLVAIAIGKTRYSHSLVRTCKEFVVNFPGESLARETLLCGSISGRNKNKFEEAKLTPMRAEKVKPPVIKECARALECRVAKEIDAGDHTIFIGEVLAAHELREERQLYDKGGRNFISL
ncbi:MAG: flavin reductase family protein [Candidatus Micrarchaeota archaeon]